MKGRLANILPDMRRLYNGGEAGELMREGQSTGIFVKLVLSADKPFMRKINGLLSHNANCFGPPSCSCTDKDLYNFTFNKKTHYGKVTFATLCHRAHVPVWQALGLKEPEKWEFFCDGCKARNPLPKCTHRRGRRPQSTAGARRRAAVGSLRGRKRSRRRRTA